MTIKKPVVKITITPKPVVKTKYRDRKRTA